MTKNLVFQLGTNNWQRQGEFAPGSGILHEAHHRAFNAMPATSAYSVYPSSTQTSGDPQVSILALSHEIPICESVSPVSSYRFHSMSGATFDNYKSQLKQFTLDAIARAEEQEGRHIDLAIAHHCFLNPMVLSEINADRQTAGIPAFKILCFAHGTALKMFSHEAKGGDPEYPNRFFAMLTRTGLFGKDSPIDLCAAISREQLSAFATLFPDYPTERMILSPNGYDAGIFRPNDEAYQTRATLLAEFGVPTEDISAQSADEQSQVIVFCGKFADWKRLDALLKAAAIYEQTTAATTLIIGSGPDDAVRHYKELAYETLGLKRTWFLGPKSHDDIAQLNATADLGVYPSRDEPFGLVFIEAMGCGTPVIGANSGGPRDFVSDAVGALVDEGPNFDSRLAATIQTALQEDWKTTKGPIAAAFAAANYSVSGQCEKLLASVSAANSQRMIGGRGAQSAG